MKKAQNTPTLIDISTLFLSVWCATNAFGGLSLTNIPTLGGDTSNEGRCITPDAKYVGGLSGTAKGFFYDVANDYVVQPPTGSPADKAVTGIAYRMDTNQSPAQLQIIVDTGSTGWKAYFMTSDAGTNWLRYTTFTYDYSLYGTPAMNSLAGTTGSDVFISGFRDSVKQNLYLARGSNLWDSSTSPQVLVTPKGVSPDTLDVVGVAATGRIVGLRKPSGGVANNTLFDYPPRGGATATQYQWNGLDGTTKGQAWSVNQDGTCIFGWSPTSADPGNNHGYKTVLSGSSPNADPPGSGITQVSVNPLPENPRTGGSTSRDVPFGCSADGNYAVGYNYTHATGAALWDTSDANPANWRVTDLNQLAADYGLGVPDVFRSLNRGYAVATNAAGEIVITGYGVDAVSGANRAYLMTVPKSIAAAGYVSPKLTMSGTYPGPLTFTYFGGLNSTTYLEYTSDLNPPVTWTVLDTQVNPSSSTVVQFTSTDSSLDPNRRFYRLRVQ